MAGGITRAVCIALILRYIGGTPLRGAVNVFANRLLVARKIGFGGLGGLVDAVVGGGLGAVFQNPLGTITGALQGAIPQAISQLKDHFLQDVVDEVTGAVSQVLPAEIQTLVDALGESGTGLFGSAESFLHHTDLLSGVHLPGDLEHGLSDLLGLAIDGSATLFTQAAAPLEQLAQLTEAEAFVTALAPKLIANELTPAAALEIVTGHRGALSAVVSSSVSAFVALQANSEAVALVQEAAAGLMDGALLGGETTRARALVERIVKPDKLATMQQAVAAWANPPDEDDDETV
jgi:hypothetical protein